MKQFRPVNAGDKGYAESGQIIRPVLRDVFSAFLRTGLTSFGMTILQNLKDTAMRQRFVTEAELQEGLALVQLYPGPIMVDLVVFIGYRSRGGAGALAATLGFLLPATAIMVAAAAAYARYGSLPWVGTMLLGLNALVVGVVLSVTIDFARKNVGGAMEVALAMVAFALGFMHINLVWAILGGLLAGAAIWKARDPVQAEPPAAAGKVGQSLRPAAAGGMSGGHCRIERTSRISRGCARAGFHENRHRGLW